ncbi:MAG: GDP-mannose 4,6-dehydratase [Firmicutes bacterium]|nr:GDP-mannose 4,6-dehydratase [Bacillota bacterium]
MKKALITGITGQDGAYLADYLLNNGYQVHGIMRRTSVPNTDRIDGLYHSANKLEERFFLHYGDLTDGANLARIVKTVEPDEIYNLAAQSHVKNSFESAEYTANTDALGTMRMLEAVRLSGFAAKTKFYQASTSELFGKAQEIPQRETTPFYPRSPYGVAKIYAYWITVNYREAYGIFACNGILFNHESPLRGESFVTRKITRGIARIKLGLQDVLYLGNLNAKRDWGYAADYVRAMWLMLQQNKPDDYVVGTGETYSVREFVELACQSVDINLEWQGEGLAEQGIDTLTGKTIIKIDHRYFRPTEVDLLVADSNKARNKLGWQPQTTFIELVRMMVQEDIKRTQKELLCQNHGYSVHDHLE